MDGLLDVLKKGEILIIRNSLEILALVPLPNDFCAADGRSKGEN